MSDKPQIDRALNLVFPLRYAEVADPKDTTYAEEKREQRTILEPVLWAYHTPISQDLFRQYFRVIAATKDALFHKGIGYAALTGIAIADLELLDAAKNVAEQQGTADVGQTLINELRRLTMVLAPKADGSGFEYVPSEIAVARDVMSKDEWHDAECMIIFFTCSSTMVLRANQSRTSAAAASLLKGSMTSLSPTEYSASLAISTRAAISEVTAASSVPS